MCFSLRFILSDVDKTWVYVEIKMDISMTKRGDLDHDHNPLLTKTHLI